jgi:hypothetical protein
MIQHIMNEGVKVTRYKLCYITCFVLSNLFKLSLTWTLCPSVLLFVRIQGSAHLHRRVTTMNVVILSDEKHIQTRFYVIC